MLISKKKSGGKNIRSSRDKVLNQRYNVNEAVDFLKKNSYVKFDETVELIFKLGVNPKHSDQVVRGITNLPAGTGKNVRIAVICNEEQLQEAKEAGADLVGEEVIHAVKDNQINFDVCICTPDMMKLVGQIARILGPKGLMPNPKLGTVTKDITTAIKNAKSGQVEYRVDKSGIIHAGVGKLSFKLEDLMKNISTLTSAVIKAKPSATKGQYLQAMYITATMSPSIKLNLSSITES